MKSKHNFFWLLFITSWGWYVAPNYARELSEAELVQLEEMANNMLAQLSPEEREQALAMAQKMEAELASLPPDKLAEVEQALQQDVQYLLSEQSPYRNYAQPAPLPAVEEQPAPLPLPINEPEQLPLDPKTATPKKSVKVIDPVQLKAAQDLLKTILEQLDLILLKTQALPRVSHDLKQEQRWQKLQPMLVELKAQLASIAENSTLTAQLLETKYSTLKQALQKFSQSLQTPVAKLTVLDTAGLKRVYRSQAPLVVTDATQKSMIQKFEALINQLLKLTPESLQQQLQQLLTEMSPESANALTAHYSPVGQKWHQADHDQARQRKKRHLKRSSTIAQPIKKNSPQKTARRIEQELKELQQLLQGRELAQVLESLTAPNLLSASTQPVTITPSTSELTKTAPIAQPGVSTLSCQSATDHKSSTSSSLSASERKLRRKLESELIKLNLQYERLLRALLPVAEQELQLNPPLFSDLKTYFSGSANANQQLKTAVERVQAQPELALSAQSVRQLARLQAQMTELTDLIAQLG